MAHAHYNPITNEQKKLDQVQKCITWYECHAHCHHPNPFNMLMAFPYLLVPENEQQEIMRGGREEAEEAEVAEQRNVQDRVEG